MSTLADELIRVAEERAPGLLFRGFVEHANFNDGTPNVRISPGEILGRHVVLLADYDLGNRGQNWLATLGLIY
eukprot:gene2245-21429_t